jgi:hypothetical protein
VRSSSFRLRGGRPSRLTVALAAVAAALLTTSAAAAQSELVLHKDGTKLYHRPSCPVVAKLEGVVAMTRAQAESRGYTAHPDCDPANPDAPAPKGEPPPPATVYLDGSKYYHRKECGKVADPSKLKAESLEVAAKKHWPCPVCRPPIRKKSTENAIPGTKRRGG